MNKNIIKLFAILVMCFMIGATLVACGAQGEQGEKGETGAQGPVGPEGAQGPQGEQGEKGEDGEDLRDCENHQWDKYEIVLSQHTYNPVTGEATIGVVQRTCVDCGDTYFFEIGHELVAGEVVAPTCQAEGYTVYTCACGYSENKDVTAKVDCIPGEKEYAKNESNICACEWNNPWLIHCTECGALLEEGNDGAAHEKDAHNFNEWNPVDNEDGVYNPCTWDPNAKVSICDDCTCKNHIKTDAAVVDNHKWSKWSVDSVEDGVYTLKRTCSGCATNFPKDGIQTEKVTLEDCIEKVTDAKCDVDGKKEYTYTIGEEVVLVDTKVIPMTGHSIEAGTTDYKVSDDFTKVTIGCKDCDKTVEVALPELTSDKYDIVKGECDYNYDTYTITVSYGEVETTVEFKVPATYGHNQNAYGNGAEWVVMDINGTLYNAYWCKDCLHWIVVSVYEG